MASAKKAKPVGRHAQLAKIHIAKKDLGLSDVEYRGLLQERYGVDSASKLNMRQLLALADHFRTLGWSANGDAPQTGKSEFIRIADDDPHASQKRYILALARKLGWSLRGLQTRIERQFGVARIEWLHDQAALQTLCKDLYNRCVRAGLDPTP